MDLELKKQLQYFDHIIGVIPIMCLCFCIQGLFLSQIIDSNVNLSGSGRLRAL